MNGFCFITAINVLQSFDMEEKVAKHPAFIRLSCTMLKIIACIAMLTDHVGYGIIRYYYRFHSDDIMPETFKAYNRAYDICNGIGRVAFPIFAFFLVEGFMRTRSVAKYALRLLIFALISEVPFDLGLFKDVTYDDHQNIMITFFIAIIMLSVIKYLTENSLGLSRPVLVLAVICTVIAFSDISVILKCDYSWKCMLLVSVLYLTRTLGSFRLVAGSAATSWEQYAPIAFVLLYFYDPEQPPKYKYAFYVFYPLHLLVIYALSRLIVG